MSAGWVRTAARDGVVAGVADAALLLDRPPRLRVAVDGVDGAGKTCFADELGGEIGRRGVPVVRASVDGFHHPRPVRYRQGRGSPEGFFDDSYDYEALRRELLDPFGSEGDGRYRTAVYDVAEECAVSLPVRHAGADAVLVLDGIFLHRAQLRGCWDLSVFLDVPFEVSVARCAARDESDPDPEAASNRRYVEGQQHYLACARPLEVATLVVDNDDLAHPVLRQPRRSVDHERLVGPKAPRPTISS